MTTDAEPVVADATAPLEPEPPDNHDGPDDTGPENESAEWQQCGECPAYFPDTKEGRMQKANHVRLAHRKTPRPATRAQTAKESADPEQPPSDDDDAWPPLALALQTALRRSLGTKQNGLILNLCEAFLQSVNVLGLDRHKFRSWISRYGLTPAAVTAAEDAVFGLEGFGPEGSSAAGGPQIQYVQGANGQPFPVIILPQGNNGAAPGPAPAATPPVIMMPPGGGEGARDPRVDRLEDMMRTVMDLLRQPRGDQGNPNVRRVRRPLVGGDGSPLTDPDGQVLYEEYTEPVVAPAAPAPPDPLAQFKTIAETIKALMPEPAPPGPPPAAAPAVDEEKLMLKIDNALLEHKATNPRMDDETKEMIGDLQDTVQGLNTEIVRRAAFDEGRAQGVSELAPQVAALQERVQVGGLSEQAQVATKAVDTLRVAVDKIGGQAKEMLEQQNLINAATAGLVDRETFGAYVATKAGCQVPVMSEEQKASIGERIRRSDSADRA